MKKVWKPTGKVFTKIRYSWKPIGRIFTIIGDRCPLTRITSKIVPPKEPTITPVKTSDLKVYSRISKASRSVVQIVLWYLDSGYSKHMTGNHSQLINFVSKFLGLLCGRVRTHLFIRDLEGVDLLKGSRGSNLYTLSLENLMLSSPICLFSKASKTKKPDLSYLHVFGSLGYPTNDGEDLGMLRPKADIIIFVGYTSAKKAFWILPTNGI
ncbi:hypothetical protein Tco_1013795 [Tanacetum coccineum]